MFRAYIASVVLCCSVLCFGMEEENEEKVLTLAEIRQELAQYRRGMAGTVGENAEEIRHYVDEMQELTNQVERMPMETQERYCRVVYPDFKKQGLDPIFARNGLKPKKTCMERLCVIS